MASSPVVLGFDFGGTKTAVAVCDLAGGQLGSATVDSRPGDGGPAALARGVRAAHRLLRGLRSGPALAAVGAATFGIPYEDHVDLAPAIPGWETVAFGRALRQAFPGVPVRMATDVKAAAAAEARWGALAGCNPALYVNLGTGLGAAIVVDGEVLVGAHGAAGEIGYNIRRASDLGDAAEELILLEEVISGRALAGALPGTNGRPLSAAEVFALAPRRGDAAAVVDVFVRELAMHVANLAVAIDPVRIAVGGGMVGSWAQLEPGLRRALDIAVPFPPELVTAAFPYDAPLIGALAIGVSAAREAQDPDARESSAFSIHPLSSTVHSPSGRPSEVQR